MIEVENLLIKKKTVSDEKTIGLPPNWEIRQLGDVCKKISNGSSVKQFEEKVGLPISRIETIWNGEIDYNRVKYIRENDIEFIKKYALQNNDILFSHINSDVHLGKTAIYKIKRDEILIHGINLLLIRVNDSIYPDFFNYQLKFLRASGKFISIAQKSVNQSSINQAKLKKVKVVFPPLPEQQKIVAKIEELFSELDKGKEQLETALRQLKIYRQAVLKWAFEGKLTNKDVKEGELPEGWELKNLGNYIDKIEAGKSYKCDERPPKEGEIGIVKVSAVSWGEYNEDASKTIFIESQYNPSYLIRKGDFLFSRANTIELVGSCVIVKKVSKKLMLSDKILRFTFKNYISKDYVLYFLRTRQGRKEIESNSTGNQDSMRNIGQQRIKQIIFPMCSIEEQNQIVQEIESRLSICDKIEETLINSLKQAESLRQSILKKAFEGKLVKEEVVVN